MDEKYLKTTWKQRLIIFIIATLLLGATVITYVSIVLSGNNSSSSTSTNTAELEERLTAKGSEIESAADALSAEYFDDFSSYRSFVRSYNAETANAEGLKVEDLKTGTGTEITEEWREYYAYYILFCADESIADSSFDDNDDPTKLATPLYGNQELIAGWTEGVIGMKLGGVRLLTVPGELAYGEEQEICGGTNSPLKFIIMAIDPGEDYRKLNEEYTEIYSEYISAAYGA